MKNVGVALTWNLVSSAMSLWMRFAHSGLPMSVLSLAVSSPRSLAITMMFASPSGAGSWLGDVAYGVKPFSQNASLNSLYLPSLAAAQLARCAGLAGGCTTMFAYTTRTLPL